MTRYLKSFFFFTHIILQIHLVIEVYIVQEQFARKTVDDVMEYSRQFLQYLHYKTRINR